MSCSIAVFSPRSLNTISLFVTCNTSSMTDNRIRSFSINSLNELGPRDGELDLNGAQFKQVSPTNSDDLTSPSWQLSELLTAISGHKHDNYQLLTHGNKLVDLLIHHNEIAEELVLQNLINRILFMFYAPDGVIRSLAYRILRYSIINEDGLYLLVQNKLLICIILSLSTDTELMEKFQCVKLISKILSIQNGYKYLSIGVIKSMVNLFNYDNDADLGEIPDTFKNLLLEILLEISLLNPTLIHYSNSFNILLRIVLDSPLVFSLNALFIIINLLNDSDSHAPYLNNIISFFDQDFKKIPHVKFQRLSFLLTIYLKNWNGFFNFSPHNFRLLHDLVLLLNNSNLITQGYIIDILLDVLGVQILPWLKSSSIGKWLSGFNESAKFQYDNSLNEVNEIFNHYLNHYNGLLSFIFIKLGLMDCLINNLPGLSQNDSLYEKSILLIASLYKLSQIYLPEEFNLQLSSNIDLHALIGIEKLNIYMKSLHNSLATQSTTSNVNKEKLSLAKTYIPTKPESHDVDLKLLLNNSKVLTIKEYNNWNWNILLDLFSTTLQSELKFNEILEKQPKFFKRLLSFYRPFKFRFCIAKTSMKPFKKILKVGCLIFDIFTKFPMGLKYLFKNKILLQMAEILAQIDPYSGIKTLNPILVESRLKNTGSIGYIKFIGELSHSNNGLLLMNQWQFFTLFNDIVEHSEFSELNNFFLIHLFKWVDYTPPNSEFRNLLDRVLYNGNLNLKLAIINQIFPSLIETHERLIIQLIVKNLSQISISNHLIELLYNHYIDHNYNNLDFLKLIISFNPPHKILANHKLGYQLVVYFLKTSEGFKYLSRFNFIDQNFQHWYDQVTKFELLNKYESIINTKMTPYLNIYKEPSHQPTFFIKNLLDSKEGLYYFEQFNLRTGFLNILMNKLENNNQNDNQNDNDNDNISTKELKQDLWIIGEINSSKYGIKLFENYNLIDALVDRFCQETNWAVKGLAFYQLGKVSLNNEGVEILDELGWITKVNSYKGFNNYCYPKSLSLTVGDAHQVTISKAKNLSDNVVTDPSPDYDHIISLIYKYSSFLNRYERSSMKSLWTIKTNNPEMFTSLDLFLKVIKIIDNSNLSYVKRNFILNLFLDDRLFLEQLLKRK